MALGAAVAVSACGSTAMTTTQAHGACAQRTGFELSLVRDRGGRPTPVAAAEWTARHGGIAGIPSSGWRLTAQDGGGATVTSHQSVLHAIRGTDGTWQVDSGTICGQ